MLMIFCSFENSLSSNLCHTYN